MSRFSFLVLLGLLTTDLFATDQPPIIYAHQPYVDRKNVVHFDCDK